MKLEDWLPETLSQDIWKHKYKFEDETLEEWFERVSGGDETLKQAIKDKKFMFGGRILANRGLHKHGKKVTYSNCYVLKAPEDNLESIFEVAGEMARTFSYGGGVGIDISKLSPKGANINNAARNTSGAVSFMDLYSLTTGLIGQHGRRGATMISIDCTHPDLLDFIDVKNDPERVTKANISVRVSDEFMQAVIDDKPWKLSFTREESGETITKTYPAKKILRKIAESNWNMAEPGLLYWDRIAKYNLFSHDPNIKYAGVNPCAEQPLPEYGACLLGSINLAQFVDNPFTKEARFDLDAFGKVVALGVNSLNDVLHEGLALHPLKKQQESVNNLRQIGLGVFGFHDMLIKMGIKYGGDKSKQLSEIIANALLHEAIDSSHAIALTDYGEYPSFIGKLDMNPMLKATFNPKKGRLDNINLAHSQILTVPPTGSIATMLGVSTALEPMYATSYTRKTQSLHGQDKYYKVYTPIVKEYMDLKGITKEEDLPDYFNCTTTIPYNKRIEIQGIWQKYIDASISSTINLPNETTIEEIEELYILGWKKGLKGLTIFRDGCERTGILSTDNLEESKASKELKRGQIIKSPVESKAKVERFTSGCGNVYVTSTFDKYGNINQTFVNKGSRGTCNSNQEAVSRLISLALRGGISLRDIVDQLKSVNVCPSYVGARGRGEQVSKGSSCPYSIALILEKYLSKEEIQKPTTHNNLCPDCKEPLEVTGGCYSCGNCGFSKCD